jgi:outer membrane protein
MKMVDFASTPKVFGQKSIALAIGLMLGAQDARSENLLELWERVVVSNPTLMVSEHQVEQARAQRDQSLSKLLPNAGVRGYWGYNDYNRNMTTQGFVLSGKGTQEYQGYYGSLQINQSLFDLPSFLKLQGADKNTEQQELMALSQRMQLAYKMVDAYLAILEAKDSIRQLEVEKKSAATQIDRLRHLNESQMAKVTDLYEVEAYGQSVETSLIEAQHAQSIATEKLREITGMVVNNPDPLLQEHFPIMERSADEWVEEALSSNPLLLSLQAGSEAAQQMIASANAEHLPTASLGLSETVANTITNNLQVTPYNIGSALFNINIPLYSGGGVEAGVRESVQKYQVTREKIEEGRRQIEKETRTAWFNVSTGQSRIESSRKEMEFREKAKVAQEKSYDVGVATIVNVLDAHRRLYKAITDHRKAKYDFIRSLVSLRLNAGSLADLDLEAVAVWFQPEPVHRLEEAMAASKQKASARKIDVRTTVER